MSAIIPIEVSARHVHLSQRDQDVLFGPGYAMKILKPLSQTGQWAAEEKVVVKGPKGEIECRVLGPCRKQTQIELAQSDAVRIGIKAPVRLSGDLKGSGACSVGGPKGSVNLPEGAIVALRHLHISDDEAAKIGVKSGDVIAVNVAGDRGMTVKRIHVRVDPSFRMNIHLDTDEGNAAGLGMQGGSGELA
ncbi:phosphate propanoyltransferase [Candidatus Uhrbacteria bacterium]|nr:phosphate propanoyltransferase [Candidatus Uhrbacteria bacterium]